jgi:hypothetical protein
MKGWKMLINSTKAHYFIDNRSLCGKWLSLGVEYDDNNHYSQDNCKGCMKKREAIAKAEGK